jgi:predicted permease
MNVFQAFEFETIISVGIALVVIFAGLFSIAFVIWWGFLMILSGGKEEKIKPAVNHIRHAIIGVGFILCVLFIFPILMDLVGLPYGAYAKPSAVFETISTISAQLLGSPVDSPSLPGGSTSPSNSLPSDFSDI